MHGSSQKSFKEGDGFEIMAYRISSNSFRPRSVAALE